MVWTEKGKQAAEKLLAFYNELSPDRQHIEPETLNCIFVLCALSENQGEIRGF